MSAARSSAEAGSGVSRGRIDKRQAILDAAFTVFAREGYGQACVRVIADEAGVAKPTVYNHLNDKENLFRHAMAGAAEQVISGQLAAIARLVDRGSDLTSMLQDLAARMLRHLNDERSWALRRLLCAEITRFPELSDIVQEHGTSRTTEALADRLARLVLAGRLRSCDPAVAAEQFIALLAGPLEERSRLGTHRVPAAELRAVGQAAVTTFLAAFGADERES